MSNVTGSELWIDGVRVRSLPAPAARVVAGSAFMEVRAPGHETVRRSIVVPPGSEWREEVNLVPALPALKSVVFTPAATPPEAAPLHHGSSQRTIGIAVGGLGVAALATGAVFGVLASKAKSDYAQHCGANIGAPSSFCDAEGVRGQSEAATKASFSTWFFAGGGLAVVAGTTLLLTAPSRGVSARVGVGVAGIVVSGNF